PTAGAVFAPKGQRGDLSYCFQKASTDPVNGDSWNVYATANGVTVGGSPGAPAPISTLQYSADGSTLTSPTGPITYDITSPGQSADGVTPLPITGIALD